MAGKGPRQSCTSVDLPSGGGQGGGRERDSGDRRWRDIGEAASVRCKNSLFLCKIYKIIVNITPYIPNKMIL